MVHVKTLKTPAQENASRHRGAPLGVPCPHSRVSPWGPRAAQESEEIHAVESNKKSVKNHMSLIHFWDGLRMF